MVGPTLIEYGTEEQKQQLPAEDPLGDEIWCQGFSEPNAGSDLARSQTRAVSDGDHYVVNGQKVWTTARHHRRLDDLLVRTDPSVPKHKGITYFLLDMHSPGITVRPLADHRRRGVQRGLLRERARPRGEHPRRGSRQGWQVGITTLMYERLALGFGLQARFEIATGATLELARRMARDGQPPRRRTR